MERVWIVESRQTRDKGAERSGSGEVGIGGSREVVLPETPVVSAGWVLPPCRSQQRRRYRYRGRFAIAVGAPVYRRCRKCADALLKYVSSEGWRFGKR